MLLKRSVLFADVALLGVALFWGMGYVAVKAALESFSPIWLIVFRFIPSFFLLAVIFRRRMARLTPQAIRSGLVAGGILALSFLASTTGLVFTTAGKQAFITTAYVVLVPLLLWAGTRRFPGFAAFLAALLCFGGMSLLTLQGDMSISLGDGLSLLSALFLALHMLVVERSVRDHDPVSLAVLQIGVVGFVALPLAPFFGKFPVHVTSAAWVALAYNIFLGTVFALVTQNLAQKYTTSTHTALILSLEGVFGALAGTLVLAEIFTGKMVVGCILILISVIFTELMPFKPVAAVVEAPSSPLP
jgi:drug/metabolite transporter (DMT)-like permease